MQLSKHLEFGTEDFNTTPCNDYEFAGSHWAVPCARSTPLFHHNKAVWEKAGLPDRAPKTWAEFDEWAPKIQSAGESHRWAWARAPRGPPGGSATCSGVPAARTSRTGP